MSERPREAGIAGDGETVNAEYVPDLSRMPDGLTHRDQMRWDMFEWKMAHLECPDRVKDNLRTLFTKAMWDSRRGQDCWDIVGSLLDLMTNLAISYNADSEWGRAPTFFIPTTTRSP